MQFKETENVELKKSTSELKEAVISISSILNKHGKGILYFGIKDDGTIIGQQVGNLTLKDISRAISDHIDPKIFPDIKVEKIDSKDCIKVEFSGHEALYSAFGRFYMRTGDEDRKLSVSEIRRLIEKKSHYVYPWGAEISDTPMSCVDVSTLRRFIKRGNEVGRISFPYDSAKNALNKSRKVNCM